MAEDVIDEGKWTIDDKECDDNYFNNMANLNDVEKDRGHKSTRIATSNSIDSPNNRRK